MSDVCVMFPLGCRRMPAGPMLKDFKDATKESHGASLCTDDRSEPEAAIPSSEPDDL
jgi:hypothetical protein